MAQRDDMTRSTTNSLAGSGNVADQERLNTRAVALMATGLWAASRVALALFTYATLLLHPGGSGQATTSSPALASAWLQWDAKWYVQIAQAGYFNDQSAGFFPLYPLLVHVVGVALGGHYLAAALLVSNLGALGVFIGLALLAAHEFGSARTASYAVTMLAAYPLAFFLAAPYTEGLFIALVAFALYGARTSRWRVAAACAFFAALTRPTGIILLAPLVWEYGNQRGWWANWRSVESWRARLVAAFVPRNWLRRGGALGALLIMAAVPLGVGLYMLFLGVRFGDTLLYVHAQQRYWNHVGPGAPASTAPAGTAQPSAEPLAFLTPSYEQARALVDLAPLVIFLILTIILVRRLPVMYTLYMVGLFALILASLRPDRLGFFVAAGRYLCAALPIFFWLGRWSETRPWLYLLLTSAGFLLQATLATVFLTGGWLV
jgi:Mannosyltransferase (PIG-V)